MTKESVTLKSRHGSHVRTIMWCINGYEPIHFSQCYSYDHFNFLWLIGSHIFWRVLCNKMYEDKRIKSVFSLNRVWHEFLLYLQINLSNVLWTLIIFPNREGFWFRIKENQIIPTNLSQYFSYSAETKRKLFLPSHDISKYSHESHCGVKIYHFVTN